MQNKVMSLLKRTIALALALLLVRSSLPVAFATPGDGTEPTEPTATDTDPKTDPTEDTQPENTEPDDTKEPETSDTSTPTSTPDSSDANPSDGDDSSSTESSSGGGETGPGPETPTYTVKFKVTGAENKEIQDAKVVLTKSDEASTHFEKSTGEDGTATFESVPDGKYTYTVIAKGYLESYAEIDVPTEEEISVSLTAKQKQTLSFGDYPPTLVPKQSYTYEATSSAEDARGEISYSITYPDGSDSSIASFDENHLLTANAAGKVTITATIAEDATYAEATKDIIIEIKEAQIAFKQAQGTKDTVVLNNSEGGKPSAKGVLLSTLLLKQPEDGTEITITLTDHKEAAGAVALASVGGSSEFIEITGDSISNYTIKPIKATTGAEYVEIKVGVDGEEAILNVTVDKVDQELEITGDKLENNAVTLTNGVKEYKITVKGKGDISFETVPNDIINGDVEKVVNPEDTVGTIKFNVDKFGEATVTVNAAGDELYNPATATIEITVEEWNPETITDCYTVTGTKIGNDWYKGSVTISASDGYTLLDADKLEEIGPITLSEEGRDKTVSFRIKNADGNISTQKVELNFNIDMNDPTAKIELEQEKSWNQLVETLTFGLFANKEKTFTVIAEDGTGSGVASTRYYISDSPKTRTELGTEEIDWKDYTDNNKITVKPDGQYFIYVKVTDNVGNVNYVSTEGVILEDKEPTISATYEKKDFYNDSIEITVTVEDSAAVKSGLKSITYTVRGGEPQSPSEIYFKEGDDTATFSIPVPVTGDENDTVTVTINAEDRAGNKAEPYTIDLKIVKETPEISLDYDPVNSNYTDGSAYYYTSRKATLTITGDNEVFNPSKVTITGGDIEGEWTTSGDDNRTHTATVTFAEGKEYSNITVNYEDKAGNTATKVDDETFVVDNTPPTGTLTLEEPGWSDLVQALTFGIWKKPTVTLTVSASDTWLDEVKYWVDDKPEETKITDTSVLKSKNWETTQNEGTIPLSTEAQYVVYLWITDKAGNETFISSNGIVVDSKAVAEKDGIVITLPETTHKHGDKNLYNTNIDVPVKVTEDANGSGIKEVTYTVTADGQETQSGTLHEFSKENPGKNDLPHVVEGTIQVDAAKNNSCNVQITVKVTDNADNTEELQSEVFDIDITKPVIEVTYDSAVEEGGYYSIEKTTATIKITERKEHFESATVMVDGVETECQWTGDGDEHIATVTFSSEGEHSLTVNCTDMAGNAEEQAYSRTFTIDRTVPTGKITGETAWDKLLTALTFGIWEKDTVTLTVHGEDVISPSVTLEYYLDNTGEPHDSGALDQIDKNEWTLIKQDGEIKLEKDEQYVVYLKITDKAGNVAYVCSDGIVVDKTPVDKSGITITLPEEDYTHERQGYNKNVPVTVAVNEEANGSGIKSVDYSVTATGRTEQKGNLYTFENPAGGPKKDDLKHTLSNLRFEITAETMNSCDVTITITVTDNAGHVTEKTAQIDIDTVAPVIGVTYDNNSAKNGTFYDAGRTATVTVTELAGHFKAENVEIEGGTFNNDWKSTGDTHTATVSFPNDGTYSYTIDYTDEAGNEAEQFSDSFTVDKTAPNGRITIEQAGWEELLEALTFGIWKQKEITLNATAEDVNPESAQYWVDEDPGETALTETELKEIKEWTPFNGETKINLSKDAQYVVYLWITDKAGNETFISSDGFVVDSTAVLEEPDGIAIGLPGAAYEHDGIDGYNSDVPVTVKVKEPENGSGIRSIDYSVTADGRAEQKGNLYTFTTSEPGKNDLLHELTREFTINAEDINSCEVTITITVEDNAGNKDTATKTIDIDTVAPVIGVTYDNNSAENGTFYDDVRTATVTITELDGHFDPAKAPVTVNGAPVQCAWSRGTDEHTATVSFTDDNLYTFTVDCTDIAGNEAGQFTDSFTVDKTAPAGTVTIGENAWMELVSKLTFGIASNQTFDISIEQKDTNEWKTYYWIDTSTDDYADANALKARVGDAWTEYTETFVYRNSARFAVYVKLVDMAGNETYISSDGHVFDNTQASISLSPSDGSFNRDVNVSVTVNDQTNGAGLKSVTYTISGGGGGALFTFDVEDPTAEDLQTSFTGAVNIAAASHNSSSVILTVTAEDRAGNISTATGNYDIDVTAPTVSLSFDNNDAYKVEDGQGYFAAGRTATLTVTERENHFNGSQVLSAIAITATDEGGNTVIADTRSLISGWTTSGSGDSCTHTLTIDFTAEARYTLSIGSFSDTTGNASGPLNTGDSVAPLAFTVDTTPPAASVTAEGLGTWDSLLETLTFGLWSPHGVSITGTYSDVTAGIESVSVYRTDNVNALTREELDAIEDWEPFQSFIIPTDEQFSVYLRVVDNCGNVTYVNTDGIIVDDSLPEIESIAPEISITPPRPVNDIYNGDVTVAVSVTDPSVGETQAYSGLREIRYTVSNMGTVTQSGVLYSFEAQNPAHRELVNHWEQADAIVVDSALNNSNDVEIRVFAVDNAGNASELAETIRVDITAPVVSVSFDNNDGDTSFAGRTLFDAPRRLTIRVTERNFDPEAVRLTVTGSNGYVPALSQWTTAAGTGNGDNTVHTATLVFDRDGDYTFDVAADDLVGNPNGAVEYGDSLSPQDFTVDLTAPVLSVSYDNSSVLNGRYYNAPRTATITVTEHNFDLSRMRVTLTATDNGQRLEAPAVSDWTHNGDVHTATVAFDRDARYTFDVAFNDMAGNAMADMEEQVFTVDTTAPAVTVSGIADGSANGSDGNIGFTVSATDTNMDVFTPVLTVVVRSGGRYETRTVDLGQAAAIENGGSYTVENLPDDGIYRLMCTVTDLAGNAFTQVLVEGPDGTAETLERSGAEALVTFSVNREGSTFELNETAMAITRNRYVRNVTDDIIITEINVDDLTASTVTLNGTEMKAGTDYTVERESGDNAWSKYTYRINASLFEQEGEYSVVVFSKDRAENDAFSDIKNAAVTFVVDRTPPVVTVSGLDTDGRYQVERQSITVIPVDDGGALNSLTVYTVDENGQIVQELLSLSGEDFEAALAADGSITFELGEGLYQNVRIVCTDLAMDTEGQAANTYDQTFTNVSVSTSSMAIFWANKPLRYGVIGGSAAAMAGAGVGAVFIIRRRRMLKK